MCPLALAPERAPLTATPVSVMVRT
jgi:hypothetical protein